MSAIPVYRETYLTRTRKGTRASASRDIGAAVCARAAWFAVIVGVTYLASSLSGNVMMEKARREGLRAQDRARVARQSEVVLQQSIDAMTGITATTDWATAHGFQAQEQLAQPKKGAGLVASNR